MAKQNNPQPTGWRYVGNGAYIPGVPARNLSVDEMKEYADLIVGQVGFGGSALYEAVYSADETVEPTVKEQ